VFFDEVPDSSPKHSLTLGGVRFVYTNSYGCGSLPAHKEGNSKKRRRGRSVSDTCIQKKDEGYIAKTGSGIRS